MEEELESVRLRHEQAERQKKNSGLKWLMALLALVALGLAGALYYTWKQKSTLVGDLEGEKQELTEQMEALQKDYESLSSDYDSINRQLDTSRAEVAQLIERIKATEATDRAKIRQYEKELGTLRSIMRGYITQIDSLNTLNHKLTADAAAARKETAKTQKKNEELTKQVETLTDKVTAGGVLKARGLIAESYGNGDRKTDRASKVTRVLTSLSLVENELAEKGPVRVYIRVKDPDGAILTNSVHNEFTLNGQTMIASASREVDYEGKEVDLSIYLNEITSWTKGVYTVEAYTDQAYLGSTEFMLR